MKRICLQLLCWFLIVNGVLINTHSWAQSPTPARAKELGHSLWVMCRAGRGDDIVSRRFSDLINQGADLNYADPDDGTTPLMWCARHGMETEFYALAVRGASPYARATRDVAVGANSEQIYLGTILTAAVQGGRYSIVHYLLEVAHLPADGTGPRNGGLEGPPPLLIAALMGELDMVLLLLNHNASINKPSVADQFVTPLMVAAGHGHEDVCEYLLKMGANPFAKDRKGRTAKDWANQNQQPKLASMIQEFIDKTPVLDPNSDRYAAGLSLYSSQLRFDNLEQIGWAYEQAGRPVDAQLCYIKAAQALYNEAQVEESVNSPSYSMANLYSFPFNPDDNRITAALSAYIRVENQVNTRTWYFLSLMGNVKSHGGSLWQAPLVMRPFSVEYLTELIRRLQQRNPADSLAPHLTYLHQYCTSNAFRGVDEEDQYYQRFFSYDGSERMLKTMSGPGIGRASAVRYLTLLIDGMRDRLTRQDTTVARQYMQKALSIGSQRLSPSDPLLASLYSALGDGYRRLGTPKAFRESEQLYGREQQHLLTYTPTDTLAQIRSLLGLANLYADWTRNNQIKARQYLQRAQALATNQAAVPTSVWLAIYGQRASLDERARHWSAAAGQYIRLLDRLRQQRQMNHPVVAVVLYNAGCAYREDGNWPIAVDYFRQARQHARQFGQLMNDDLYTYVKTYAAYADFPANQGLWKAYNSLTGQTSATVREAVIQPWLLPEARFRWLTGTERLVDSLAKNGQLKAIDSRLAGPVRMLEQRENQSPFTIRAMLALARAYQTAGAGSRADTLYDRTVRLALTHWGEKNPVYWRAALQQMAARIGRQPDDNRAEADLRRIVELMRTKHRTVQPYLPAAQAHLYQQETEALFSMLMRTTRQLSKPGEALLTDLFEFSVQIRSYQLNPLERLVEARRKNDRALDEAFEDLKDYRDIYEREVQNQNPTPDEQRALESTVADMNLAEEGVRRLLLKGHQRSPLPVFRIAALQKRLSPAEAVVHFIRVSNESATDADYLAFVIRSGKQPLQLINLTTERELRQRIPATPSNLAALAAVEKGYQTLYRHLWAPLTGYLTGATSVQYSPAGLIHRISIPGLINEQGEPLVKTITFIGRLSTDGGTANASLQARPRLLLFGNIEFDPEYQPPTANRAVTTFMNALRAYKTGPWLPLGATAQEVDAIRDLARTQGWPTTVRTGSEATEQQLVQDLTNDRPAIVHLATHGFHLGYHPDGATFTNRLTDPMLRSGITLAGVNGTWLGSAPVASDRDGILTALEVSALPMSSVYLAVLSACETGLGDMQGAEAVSGMAQALKIAGVNYVLVSLWPVPDTVTKELMTEFYRALTQKLPVQEALQRAQRTMATRFTTAEWAGFVLIQ